MSTGEDSSSRGTPKFCPTCGTPVKKENAKFCTQCGRDFTKTPGKSADPSESSPSSSTASPVPSGQSGASSGASSSSSSSTSSTFTGSMEQQAVQYDQETRPRKTYDMVTPNDIRPVQSKLFNREEIYIILIFSAVGFISHLMRYFLLFNSFPNLINFFLPIPIYVIAVAIIFLIQKYLMRSKGIAIDIHADRFDYTRSMVFSSFFLTLLPPKLKIDQENSNVPDSIYTPQSTERGLSYQQVSRSQYVGQTIRPRMIFLSNFLILIVAFFSVLLYFNLADPNIQRVFRIVTLYISSFVIVELAPVFGRNNEVSSEYGRLRTLGVFIATAAIFLTSLLGQQFFFALQSLAP